MSTDPRAALMPVHSATRPLWEAGLPIDPLTLINFTSLAALAFLLAAVTRRLNEKRPDTRVRPSPTGR